MCTREVAALLNLSCERVRQLDPVLAPKRDGRRRVYDSAHVALFARARDEHRSKR